MSIRASHRQFKKGFRMKRKTLLLTVGFLLILNVMLVALGGMTSDRVEISESMESEPESSDLADSPWPCFGHDRRNKGRSPYDTSHVDGTVKWNFSTGWDINSSPAIGKNHTIYIGGDENLYALYPNGTEKWSASTGGNIISSSPAVSSTGIIYVGSFDHHLYAFYPNGTEKWSFNAGHSVYSSPAIGSNGTIYFGSGDEQLYALDPNGTEKWSFQTEGFINSSPAIGKNGTIYIGSWDNNLYAIHPNGTEKWRFSTGSEVHSSPSIASDGTIYVGSEDNKTYAVYPNGTEKWKFSTGNNVQKSPSIGADGTIYVGSKDDNLYALYLENGTEKWNFSTGGAVHSSPAIGSDGTIYFGSYGGKLYALNHDGTEKWNFSTGYPVVSPAIGSDGRIYVGSHDDNLYAIGEDTEPPVADAGVDQTVSIGEEFTLNGSGSSDNVGIVNHTWMIEGTENYGMEVKHSFSEVGTYNIILNVRDEAGNYDTDTVTITVEDQTPPTAVATANRTTVNVFDPIQFDASDSSDNVEIINYSWNFEDGNLGSGETVTHSYGSAENYTVTLTVSDAADNTDSETLNITVEQEPDTEPPVADAGSDQTVAVGEDFTLNGSGSSDNVGIVNYTWVYDGNEYYGVELIHSFSEPGTYTITLNVSDEAANYDTDTVSITVEDQTVPDAEANANKTVVKVGDPISLEAKDSSDNLNITSYSWEFGDGETATGEVVTHSYASTGNYTVTLTVSDAAGNTGTDTLDITVEEEDKDTEPPVADAGEDRTVKVGENFTLDGSNSTDNVGIENYTWTIEGEEYKGVRVTYNFSNEENHTIKLTVEDAAGITDSDTVTITVKKEEHDDGDDQTDGEDQSKSEDEDMGWLLYLIPLIIVIFGLVFWRSQRTADEQDNLEEALEEDGEEEVDEGSVEEI